MKQRVILVLGLALASTLHSSAQVALKPWLQVYGTVKGQELGKYVLGITPSTSLPYRAAVSRNGSTSFFRLQSPTDTAAQMTLAGEDPLVGDLNGDGWEDLALVRSGPGQFGGEWDTVYIFWGTATGLDTLSPLRIPAETLDDMLRPACIGDLNNDGKPDLVLTAWFYPYPYNNGKAYVFLNPVQSAIADVTVVGDSASSGFGIGCAIGDLNNDGYNDLVLRGNNQAGPQPTRYDYLNIYWGVGPDTLSLTLGMQLRGYNLNIPGVACFDVNGDGIPDLLWVNRDSTMGADYVNVHFGNLHFSSVPSMRLQNPAAFGLNAVLSAGDMNGDGFQDVMVTSPDATILYGFVFIYGGGPNIDGNYDGAVGLSSNSQFGTSAATLGDLNGDGSADIIVGASDYELGFQQGYWGIFLGDSTMKVTGVGRSPTAAIPEACRLLEAYPNPFNPTTTLNFELPQNASVELVVYDVLGREIAILARSTYEAGYHSVTWDARSMASGVYYARFTASDESGKVKYSKVGKLLLIR